MSPRLAVMTSLYRTGRFLADYCQRLTSLARDAASAGLPLEVAIVANDATPNERARLDALMQQAPDVPMMLKVIHVPRESLYASWNRAVEMMDAPIITPWNVDDLRTLDAMLEGVEQLEAKPDALLIDFPMRIRGELRYFNRVTLHRERVQPAFPQATPDAHPGNRWRANAFFLFRREAVTLAGGFDPRFRIAGDHEWHVRLAQAVDAEKAFLTGKSIAGTFVQHSGNLSLNNQAAIRAEENMISLLHEESPRIRAVDADVMRRYLARFELEPPASWLEHLMSESTRNEWQAYQQMLRRQARVAAFRTPFSVLVDVLRLRDVLSKRGLVSAQEESA